MGRQFGYLHGFSSSRESFKGRHMASVFTERGLHLERAELNAPSFSELTFTGSLGAVDAMVTSRGEPVDKWCLYGSSMGGYLAARWAQLHPERVERLVLMCPGFALAERWPELLGVEDMIRWEAEGALLFDNAEGVPTPVHWGFVEDCLRHPSWPEVPCPTLIIHGTRDETVLIDSSRRYAAERPDRVALIEVDDDHSLTASIDLIARESLRFLGLDAP